jgi:hypothetical protein
MSVSLREEKERERIGCVEVKKEVDREEDR